VATIIIVKNPLMRSKIIIVGRVSPAIVSQTGGGVDPRHLLANRSKLSKIKSNMKVEMNTINRVMGI
jgi:hypothetical protein